MTFSSGSTSITVKVESFKPTAVTPDSLQGFVEGDGYVSMEAEHFTGKTDAADSRWEKLNDYGRTLSAMRSVAPVDSPAATPGKDSPCLEYRMYIFHPGKVTAYAIVGPTLNFVPDRGLSMAMSMDVSEPREITNVPKGYVVSNRNREWAKAVSDNARTVSADFTLGEGGYHTLKVWMVDPGVVVERIMVDTGGLKPSYLGPPESYRR